MDEDKKTALIIAIENKHEEVVQLLIAPTAAAGAINAQDTEGNSALMLATSGCHSTIMGKLREVGATVSSAVLIPMIKPETAALALNLIQDETLKIDHNVATLMNENLSQTHRPIELLMASDDDTCHQEKVLHVDMRFFHVRHAEHACSTPNMHFRKKSHFNMVASLA